MKVRRRFLLALMASVLLHLGIVTGPGWILPSLEDWLGRKPAPALDAWLVKAEAPEQKSAPTPRVRPKPAPTAPQARGDTTVMPIPVPEAQSEAPAAEPEREESTESRVSEGDVLEESHQILIRYSVTRGTGGFVVGESLYEFRNDGRTYFLRSEMGTTGLARLFKSVHVLHSSEGDVIDGHLRPREFRVERNGRAAEWAWFDWESGRVTLSEGDRSFPLEAGIQDMLSVFGELSLTPIDGSTISLPVVTGRKIDRYEFTVVGEETLATPMGDQRALHMRTRGRGEKATEVWLGLDQARLPLRIRHVDGDGEVFDQTAGSVEITTSTERPH